MVHQGRFDARPLLVPPGTVSRLTQMEMTANTVQQLEKDLDALKDSLATSTAEVADLWVEKGQLLARVEAAEKLLRRGRAALPTSPSAKWLSSSAR